MENASVEARATMSKGTSGDAIHQRVLEILKKSPPNGCTAVDVGCGTGAFLAALPPDFSIRIGIDVVKHPGLSNKLEFRQLNLENGNLPVDNNSVDLVTCLEVLEHLENPRATVRELARIAKPGGTVVLSTPNLLSALNLLTLIFKSCHNAFQDGDYPAHITPILEKDLERMAQEVGFTQTKIYFTQSGRMPGTAASVPRFLSRIFPRRFSDNIILVAKK